MYSVSVKHNKFSVFIYYLAQHVSTLTGSYSGPSKIQILKLTMFKMHCVIPNANILNIAMYKTEVPLDLITRAEYLVSKI